MPRLDGALLQVRARMRLRLSSTTAVPENPARTFHEAVQSLILIYLALILEGGSSNSSVGRSDEYMWPYFERDIRERRPTLERAADLVGSVFA